MAVLNDAQFAAQVNAGGASRQLGTMKQGPASGYYVSRHQGEGAEYKIERPATAVDASFHRTRSLQTHPPDMYQGGWPHKGATYFDVSERIPNFHHALRAAQAHAQIAMYDAARGADVTINHGPKRKGRPSVTDTDLRAGAAHYTMTRDASEPAGWRYA